MLVLFDLAYFLLWILNRQAKISLCIAYFCFSFFIFCFSFSLQILCLTYFEFVKMEICFEPLVKPLCSAVAHLGPIHTFKEKLFLESSQWSSYFRFSSRSWIHLFWVSLFRCLGRIRIKIFVSSSRLNF